MKGMFLTGITGNIGSRLAIEWLHQTELPLHALVRAVTPEQAWQRVREALAFWELNIDEYQHRLFCYCGDVVQPELGLNDTQQRLIQAAVDVVVHAAANLRLDLSWEQAEEAIVGGTRHVYGLFQGLTTKTRFLYVSTLEVMGRYPGRVEEEFLTDYPIEFLNTYEQGKFTAEKFLQQQLQVGAPIMIVRPGMVVGEAETGRIPSLQSFYLALEKMILKPDSPVLPRGVMLDLIPVDFLARGILLLLKLPMTVGSIFHFSQGLQERKQLVDYERMAMPILSKEGLSIPRRWFVAPIWHQTIVNILACISFGQARRYFRAQQVFLAFFGLNWAFDNQRTRNTLAQHGLAWPKVEEYFPRLLSYYLILRQQKKSHH